MAETTCGMRQTNMSQPERTLGFSRSIFFIAAIVYCFKYLGTARKAAGRDYQQAWFVWLLGAALFSNTIAFMGISYYDQTSIYWYALLAMIVATSVSDVRARAVPTLSGLPNLNLTNGSFNRKDPSSA